MQVWDQVKVKASGQFEGRAGLVIRYYPGEKINVVRLDSVNGETVEIEPQNFTDDELQLLS